jgi:hypothetical protein
MMHSLLIALLIVSLAYGAGRRSARCAINWPPIHGPGCCWSSAPS